MVNGIFIRNYALYMSGGQNYLLLAMDMAKVGGPLSLVKVYMSMLSVKIGYRQVGGLLLVVKFWTQIWTSQVHSLLLYIIWLFIFC